MDTTLDALELVKKLGDKGEKSRHLFGHISKEVIDDTFLAMETNKYPESLIGINCYLHAKPAAFYDRREQNYKCLECLIGQDLLYIEKKYKQEMEDFEAIREFTVRAIAENTPHTHLIKDWKNQVRSTLMEVRKDFLDWIDTFTHKFMRSLNGIVHTKDLQENHDHLMRVQCRELKSKHDKIIAIF